MSCNALEHSSTQFAVVMNELDETNSEFIHSDPHPALRQTNTI